MKRYFIGVDNGGTMTKAAVFDAAGRQLASTRRLTAINTPNIHSRPEISGILMAAAMYINLVKGCTLVR